MKILFVSRGSRNSGPKIIVRNQANSLLKQGVDIDFYTIYERGLFGYLKEINKLRNYIKRSHCDIIHAHYVLSGWSAILSFCRKPIIISLMGTDAYGIYIKENRIKFYSHYLIFLTYLIQPFAKAIICKSENIQNAIYLKRKSTIIPNGIDFNFINSIILDKEDELKFDISFKHILFIGDKTDIRKNYKLAEEAVKSINDPSLKLISPFPLNHSDVIKYLKFSNVLIVPSLMEGSPNIVKEAMACNIPVVATNVGDIEWLFGDEPGHFLTTFDPEDVADKIEKALEFSDKHGRTNGRERIIKLGLDAESIAKRITIVYKSVLTDGS